jgi:protein gp37
VSEKSAIEWTDATFNPWWGCSRVSPACAHCYADATAKRFGQAGLWEDGGRRRFLSEAYWTKPLSWNTQAERAGEPLKVFCASMADVFEEHAELDAPRERLWELIEQTPWLQWQLLTKRPENVGGMAPWGEQWPANVWLGVSIENSRFTFRADLLRETAAHVRFISAEPLLASVFLNGKPNRRPLDLREIDWLIAGGESGPHARPTDPGWLRELRDQCERDGVAFFLKQLGGWPDKRGRDDALLDDRLWRELPAAPPPPN